ncbi:MAG: alpha/beta hydrolase fold domain-containing protein, partial [Gammaproteobacteria bacterium]|nr:alpha/beta hydrolase fold domain-containing protein [Gammaproteobacteria bacterium]
VGRPVALVRYRRAGVAPCPSRIEDVAAAVAFVLRNRSSLPYDPALALVMGHSAGRHLVARLGLDPAHLASHQ